MTDWKVRAEALADELVAGGWIRDPAWRAAFAGTPRHLFVPSFYRLDDYNQPRVLLSGQDPEHCQEWLDRAYRNQVLVTHYRVVGTNPDGQETRAAAGSASMPSAVAMMLERLTVADGNRVLEIGTGTGYNVALLCARLGDQRVTSIEVDPVTAAAAAEHLRAAGWRPALLVGDGAAGQPDRAPFDRIIATCAVDRVPVAWIDQLAGDGIIVTPLTYAGGPLAVLSKTSAGEVAGRLAPERAYFMPIRPAGDATAEPSPASVPGNHPTDRTTTGVEPGAWDGLEFRLWHALHQPEAQVLDRVDRSGRRTGVVVYTSTGRATVDYVGGAAGSWPVTHDSVQLWDTVEAAWEAWCRHGEPDRTRVGITARSDGDQFAWLDDPDGAVRWSLPAG